MRGLARIAASLLVLLALALLQCAQTAPHPFSLRDERLLVGIGDRMTVEREGRWATLPERAAALDLDLDLLAIWLTRDWQDGWVTREQLSGLTRRGITPVVVHYFFGDDISVERVQADREAWFTSLWRLGQLVAIDAPVLVVLEPEWNVHAPAGQHAVVDSPWFAEDFVNAAAMIREQAPNALVGVCPGDFSPDRNLHHVLDGARHALDFLCFQEMRASTDRLADQRDYLEVGAAALDYARYLSRDFGLPVLLGYVAISSYGGASASEEDASHEDWEAAQVRVLDDLAARREALRRAGVFGLLYFQLFDDPAHRGYFGAAEPHFGLIAADGRAKPGLAAFRRLLTPGRAPTARGR